MKKFILLILIIMLLLSIFLTPNSYKYEYFASSYSIIIVEHEEPNSIQPIIG
jgi:hypothetical protein